MNSDGDVLIQENTPIGRVSDSNYDSTDNERVISGGIRQFPQYFAAFTSTLSALSAGAVLGWTSPILDALENAGFRGLKLDSSQIGWVGSLVTLGAMSMCIPTGIFCNLLGRKKTLVVSFGPFIIGWALIYFAESVWMLYFGRFLTGTALGIVCVAAPLYTSEIAHKSIRGALSSYFQLMITLGIFLAYLFGKYLTVYVYTLICSMFPAIFLLFFAFQPESPVYLTQKGDYVAAFNALQRLRGQNCDSIEEELTEIANSLKESSNVTISLTQTIRLRPVKKALLIAFSLMFFQQFSGINAIIMYVSDIFQAGNVTINPKTAALLVAAAMASTTFLSTLIIDKLGRRFLLFLSGSVIFVSTSALALYFTLQVRAGLSPVVLQNLSFLPVGSVCLFVVVFSLGLGPIPWMISAEIFPPKIKSLAGSIAGTFNWFLAFLVTKFYKEIADWVGVDVVFYVFALCSLIGAIFVYFVVPETKGKTIEEVQRELDN